MGYEIYLHLWKYIIPKKYKIFIWSLLRECINTIEILQKRLPKWNLNPSWCVIYTANEENRNHLFNNCPYRKGIWEKVGVLLHHPYNFDNGAFLCKYICKTRPKLKKQVIHLNMVVITLLSTWLERNKRTFNGEEISLLAL